MIALVKELKALMAEKHLSPEKASHFLDCSTNSVIRWIKDRNRPSQTYRRKIKEGMARIREAYPNPSLDLAMKAKGLWSLVKKDLTFKEKARLFDINQEKGVKAYIIELERLVRKYGKAGHDSE